jgi:hypothetical protein
VATELARLGLGADSPAGEDQYFVTDSAERFERIAAHVLGHSDVRLEHVDI